MRIIYQMEVTKGCKECSTLKKAIAYMMPCTDDYDIQGIVYMRELYIGGPVEFNLNIEGLPKSKAIGFHIHESGDYITNGCTSLCAHFNPTNTTHGALNDANSHIGDLGNIVTDENGICKMTIVADRVRLRGPHHILGRSLIVHEDTDDLGLGSTEESLKTGNSGKRIAFSPILLTKTC